MRVLFLFTLILSSLPIMANPVIVAGLQTVTSMNNGVIECNDPPIPSRILEVARLNDRGRPITSDAGNCSRGLPPNTHRLMRRDGYKSGHYLMRNLGNNRYAAVINLDFKPATSTNTGLTATAAQAASIRARTMNCLREMGPYLRGPGGAQLDIQVITPEDEELLPRGVPMPEPYEIKVTPERDDFRGNAGNYGTNFQCHTIGHEILHFLGLCDEYHEGVLDEGGGRYVDWRCRAIQNADSYMRNIWYPYRTSLPLTSRCECNEECQRIMREPEDVRRMYLGMQGDDIMMTESDMFSSQIVSMNGTTPVRRTLCRVQNRDNIVNARPPVMSPFTFHGQSGEVFTFKSYRPRIAGTDESPLKYYEQIDYICDCTGETQGYCRRMMETFQRRARTVTPRVTCPVGAAPLNGPMGPSIGQQPGFRESGMSCDSENRCQLIVTSPGTGRSLLRDQHFHRIVAGNCRGGAASNYERCEEFAYRGKNPANFDHSMPIPEQPGNQCTNIPQQCFDERIVLDGAPWGPTTQAE